MQHAIRSHGQNVNIELDAAAVTAHVHPNTQYDRDTTRYRPSEERSHDNISYLYFLALDFHSFLPEIHADGCFSLAGEGSAGEAEG